jgi:predicted nuclease with TOPRIM domain
MTPEREAEIRALPLKSCEITDLLAERDDAREKYACLVGAARPFVDDKNQIRDSPAVWHVSVLLKERDALREEIKGEKYAPRSGVGEKEAMSREKFLEEQRDIMWKGMQELRIENERLIKEYNNAHEICDVLNNRYAVLEFKTEKLRKEKERYQEIVYKICHLFDFPGVSVTGEKDVLDTVKDTIQAFKSRTEQFYKLELDHAALGREFNRRKDTNTRLNRRCQEYESTIAHLHREYEKLARTIAKPQEINDMKLPDGWTCKQCIFFKRCQMLISVQGHETTCDWSPSRFRKADPQ